jgi:uncharacterized phage protein (TIGR02218 family)
MTFDTAERAIAAGRPMRLYRFTRGTMGWRYNSSDRDVMHQAQRYSTVAGGIADDGIRQTGQSRPDGLVITAPADLAVAQLYRQAPPSSPVALTVFARHHGIDDFVVIWSGSVRAVKWPQIDRCAIECAPMSASMETTGLRLAWGRTCPHALYSAACGVSSSAWRVEAIVQSMDGASVSNGAFAGYPSGYFTGGYVEWSIGGGEYDRRGIERHAGSTLTLMGGTAGIALNAALRAYPGCAQTVAACKGFSNLANYGGIPHLSGKSPFDGTNPF